jgi:hypothetical protein
MDSPARDDIRRLLKTFGVGADEALIRHLARTTFTGSLRVHLVLEDLTDYGPSSGERLHFEVEGEVRR